MKRGHRLVICVALREDVGPVGAEPCGQIRANTLPDYDVTTLPVMQSRYNTANLILDRNRNAIQGLQSNKDKKNPLVCLGFIQKHEIQVAGFSLDE